MTTTLQIRSLIKGTETDGELELSLVEAEVPELKDDELLLRVEAAPLNPSDFTLLFGAADMTRARYTGTKERPIVNAPIPQVRWRSMSSRQGKSMPVGIEGAGLVVDAGSSPAAQALKGKTVAALGGGMYGQYRAVTVEQCLELPAGVTFAEAASSFVNPLTALGMVETMRQEKHTALVHTAAASSVGQMLQKLCTHDDVKLVNIVRRPEQKDILRELGATFVVDSSSPTFELELVEALAETGATVAFDAIGGGRLVDQILDAMAVADERTATEYHQYGSTKQKQVYIYGGLDPRPTDIRRSYGLAWGTGGWFFPTQWAKYPPERLAQAKARVARELTSTFATTYARELSLAEVLSEDAVAAYYKRATGEKHLVLPGKA